MSSNSTLRNLSPLLVGKIILHSLRDPAANPAQADLEDHLHAAIDWLLHAATVNGDGGIAAGYKPLQGRWAPSYPETTGYTIPTLLEYAARYQREDVRRAAMRMASYELKVQLPEGGFPCLPDSPGDPTWPVAFDTGQVLFGLIAAHQATGDESFAASICRAADWLVSQQTADGFWNDYHSQGSLRAIDARVSWALLQVFELTGDRRYRQAAVKQLNWVLAQQQENGWFEHCSFSLSKPPITHTLAYTIEGLLESGLLTSDDRYLCAAQKAADRLLERLAPSGFLPGAFLADWSPAASWSCLTGSAQMARLWLRLEAITGLSAYRQAAGRAIRFLAATQLLDGMPVEVRGGIAGSWPVYGEYMRLKYLNWAANFFADAILKLTVKR